MSDSPSQAKVLAAGWIPHFFSADRAIRWRKVETEYQHWLDDRTFLTGRIDAEGDTEDGEPFFADWKTLSAKMRKRIGEVKAEYRLSPQMLTYGYLTKASGGNRFMVRWAVKGDPPIYDYEWYTYTDGEIAWWGNMIRNIAAHIHHDRAEGKIPWVTNLTACRSKYGPLYDCPFLGPCCSKQQWSVWPYGATERGSHLEIERKMQAEGSTALVLDATCISTWLSCNERYRREYHDGITGIRPAHVGPSKDDGTEFHDLLHTYYNKLREAQ